MFFFGAATMASVHARSEFAIPGKLNRPQIRQKRTKTVSKDAENDIP
jgi:hypothetical protein